MNSNATDIKREKFVLPSMRKVPLTRCISTYGKKPQVDMAIEEMSELIKALLKERRAQNAENQVDIDVATLNIAEEMADVLIMVAQLTMIFDNWVDVQAMITVKQSRQEERLDVNDKTITSDTTPRHRSIIPPFME